MLAKLAPARRSRLALGRLSLLLDVLARAVPQVSKIRLEAPVSRSVDGARGLQLLSGAAGLLRMLVRVLRRHGFVGSLRLLPRNLRALFYSTTPAARRALLVDQEFDREFGLDTSGMINVSQMSATSSSLLHANRYQTQSAGQIRRRIESLDIEYHRYTFIDIGAGKGRVLLVATLFPFQKIIGVEFDPALCRIAETNLARYRPKDRVVAKVDIVQADARTFIPPPGPLCVYLYNPFDGTILQRVLDNLRLAFAQTPGMSLLLYVQPDHREVLDNARFLRLERADGDSLIYRSVTNRSGG